jgi:hypothetical protein
VTLLWGENVTYFVWPVSSALCFNGVWPNLTSVIFCCVLWRGIGLILIIFSAPDSFFLRLHLLLFEGIKFRIQELKCKAIKEHKHFCFFPLALCFLFHWFCMQFPVAAVSKRKMDITFKEIPNLMTVNNCGIFLTILRDTEFQQITFYSVWRKCKICTALCKSIGYISVFIRIIIKTMPQKERTFVVWICNLKKKSNTESKLKHFERESNFDYYNVLFWHTLYNDLNKDRKTSK